MERSAIRRSGGSGDTAELGERQVEQSRSPKGGRCPSVIQSSPLFSSSTRGLRSASSAMAEAFLPANRKVCRVHTVDTRNVREGKLPFYAPPHFVVRWLTGRHSSRTPARPSSRQAVGPEIGSGRDV